MAATTPILVIGLGNEFRCDDRVGLFVAAQIKSAGLVNVRVLQGVSDAVGLIESWDEADAVFVVDCAVSGGPPGTVYQFDGLADHIPEMLFSRYSSHAFSVVDALALAGALGRLPSKLVIYAIEAANCDTGTEMTPVVVQSARRVVTDILEQIHTIE